MQEFQLQFGLQIRLFFETVQGLHHSFRFVLSKTGLRDTSGTNKMEYLKIGLSINKFSLGILRYCLRTVYEEHISCGVWDERGLSYIVSQMLNENCSEALQMPLKS